MPQRPQHGFISVDDQADPNEWVAVLDKLRAEPFYAAYKQRVVELLEPRIAHAISMWVPARATMLADRVTRKLLRDSGGDRSLTMATTCRTREEFHRLCCDAGHLPFPRRRLTGRALIARFSIYYTQSAPWLRSCVSVDPQVASSW